MRPTRARWVRACSRAKGSNWRSEEEEVEVEEGAAEVEAGPGVPAQDLART